MSLIKLTIELNEALGDFEDDAIADAIMENGNADDVITSIFKKSDDPVELLSFVLAEMSPDLLKAFRVEIDDELARRNGKGGYGK